MTTTFDQLPDSARLWIYQGSRKLTSSETNHVSVDSKEFIGCWQTHGQPLKADASVVKNQFLVIAVDDSFSLASGCSIDASVNLVKKLSAELEVDFLDRKNIAFLIQDEVKIYPFNEIGDLVKRGEILPETLVFNNLVQNLGEWRSSWLIPSSESWLKRYFN
ncbi:MAG: hypothetical protein GY816_12715 [Cytophagales bacterium]|nr:hypothetical protein [Cytophagales bacterium]